MKYYSRVVSVDEELLESFLIFSSEFGVMLYNVVSVLESLDGACNRLQADCCGIVRLD